MQSLLTLLIVLGAVAYVAWQWMPTFRGLVTPRTEITIRSVTPSTCSACNTCGACAKGQ